MMLRDDWKLVLRCSASEASENELTKAVKSTQASRTRVRALARVRPVAHRVGTKSPRGEPYRRNFYRPEQFILEEQEQNNVFP